MLEDEEREWSKLDEGEIRERREKFFEHLKEMKWEEARRAEERKKNSKDWRRKLIRCSTGMDGIRLELIKQAYFQYRLEHGIPLCCDTKGCHLNGEGEKTLWMGKVIRFVVTKLGDQNDYRPQSLMLLCPNCWAQFNQERKEAARAAKPKPERKKRK